MAKRNSLQDAKKEMWISRIRELEAELAEALEKSDKLVLEAQRGEKVAVDKLVDLRRELMEARAELEVRDNMGDEVLRILREATGRRDFHSEMEAAEWAAKLLAEARRDGARLEWLESQCVFQMAVPQFWRNRNGKISFAPYDEAKLVEGENVRAAIDAAMKEAQ